MSIAVFNKINTRIDALRVELETANARIAELERANAKPQQPRATITLPERHPETKRT